MSAYVNKGARWSLSADIRFQSKVNRADNSCLLWTGAVGSHGYGNFWDGKRFILAHRFAWEQAHGPIPGSGHDGPVIMQTCDNKLCCEETHLKLGTHADNHADCIAKDRGPQYRSPLTAKQQKEVKDRWVNGESQQKLADVYGVTQGTISRYINKQFGTYVRSSR